MDVDISQLRNQWRTVCRPFMDDKQLVEAIFANLVEQYGEDGRYYHNLQHIHNVLMTIDNLESLLQDETAVRLAAWFHDIIYDAQPANEKLSNEERSANYADQALHSFSISKSTRKLIQKLILATQLNYPVPDDPNFHVLLDADLAILAANCNEYNQYAWAIRQEFAFVPEAQYRSGRRQVLQSFLERERIFLTDKMFQEREAKARLNIQHELANL